MHRQLLVGLLGVVLGVAACSATDGASVGGGAGAASAGRGGDVAQSGSAGHAGESAGTAGSGLAGSGGASGSGMQVTGPRLSGRFDTSTAGQAVFAWSGSAVSLRFSGASVAVTLTDSGNNRFDVEIDGQSSVLATKPGKGSYPLASGLGAGPHSVSIRRRTEAFFGETTFHGFDVEPSAFLPSPLPARRLEVIGDSISAGYGNEGTNPCSFEAATENHSLSYEALAAKALGADLHTEAWSGIGVLRNVDGTTSDTMPQRYARTLPERAASSWDFSAFVPDALVVNLGTNDFAMGDPGAPFQAAYADFVAELRGHYPRTRIYLAVGSMLDGAAYAKAASYLKAVIAARAGVGDTDLALLEFGSQLAADGYGCDYHPSLATHRKMAGKLVATLKADLGW